MSGNKGRKRLLLIDGNNYLNRAFYATPRLTSPSGEPTNAVKGFINILIADLNSLRPSHVCITFDKGGKPNWRKSIYPEYKANRKSVFDKKDKKSLEKVKAIKDMKAQMLPLKQLIRAMGFRVLNKSGVEADDLMGTLAKYYEAKGFEVIIGSNDKDMAQLVGGDIRLLKPTRELHGQIEVFREFGVRPSQIVDYLSLLGDSVDNIVGLRGVGAVKARELLGEYGSIAKIIKNNKKLKPAMMKAFASAGDQMKLNRRLITLKTDESHKVKTSQLVYPCVDTYNAKRVTRLCKEMGLKQTLNQIQGLVAKWTTPSKKSKSEKLW